MWKLKTQKSRREKARDALPLPSAGDKRLAAWVREHHALLEDILMNDTGFKVTSGKFLEFQIGHQGFRLDYRPESNAGRKVMTSLLERALDRLEGSRPDESVDICGIDYLMLRNWLNEGPRRKPAQVAFSAGPARNVARLIEETMKC